MHTYTCTTSVRYNVGPANTYSPHKNNNTGKQPTDQNQLKVGLRRLKAGITAPAQQMEAFGVKLIQKQPDDKMSLNVGLNNKIISDHK